MPTTVRLPNQSNRRDLVGISDIVVWLQVRWGIVFRGHTPESPMSRIARHAHEIYEARSGRVGTAMEDWLAAERQVDE
jgi:hypothetical protein